MEPTYKVRTTTSSTNTKRYKEGFLNEKPGNLFEYSNVGASLPPAPPSTNLLPNTSCPPPNVLFSLVLGGCGSIAAFLLIPGIFLGFTPKGYMGHTGGAPGVATSLFFKPKQNTGKLLMINTSVRGSEGGGQSSLVFGMSWISLKIY